MGKQKKTTYACYGCKEPCILTVTYSEREAESSEVVNNRCVCDGVTKILWDIISEE